MNKLLVNHVDLPWINPILVAFVCGNDINMRVFILAIKVIYLYFSYDVVGSNW